METGKVTITFKDDDTCDLEIENIDGLELLDAAAAIINDINERFDMPI